MKKLILIFTMLFATGISAFATQYVDASYDSENVGIYQFLGYDSMFADDAGFKDFENVYQYLEEEFNRFCYFTDALLEISDKTGKKISFYSEPVASKLQIGETLFYFHPAGMKGQIQEVENQFFTDEYKNPYFIVPFVCEKLNLKVPQNKNADRKIYSLEAKTKIAVTEEKPFMLDDRDSDLIFFYPCGDGLFSPYFSIEGKNYIGFYYSKSDADSMKKLLKEKYSIDCKLKEFTRNFKLINEAYFADIWQVKEGE